MNAVLRHVVAPIAVAFLLVQSAAADLISPDSATASSFFASFGGDQRFDPINTINGSGLPANFGPGDAHADYSFSGSTGNHWTTAGQLSPTSEAITWYFNTPQALDAIYVWNHRSSVPPAGNPLYDVTRYSLRLFDASNTVLQTFADVALAPDIATGQIFSFGGTISGVSSVLFLIEETQGTPNFTGLAEVAFNAVAVPEANAMLCLSVVTVGMCCKRRKRLDRTEQPSAALINADRIRADQRRLVFNRTLERRT